VGQIKIILITGAGPVHLAEINDHIQQMNSRRRGSLNLALRSARLRWLIRR
jgi:hypothetical protein